MSNIGAGLGTSYPVTLDTQTTPEVDSPSASKTLARAAVPNDLAAAVIAIETALGTSPQGTKTNVKTFLQTEHGVDGTHQTQLTMASGSAAAPQIKGSSDATGFFFPANVIGFSTAGVEIGRFTSSGLAMTKNKTIFANTTDGADNGYLTINGGGGSDVTRGGSAVVYGNEWSGTAIGGSVELYAGNISTGDITFFTANGVERLRITNGGSIKVNTNKVTMDAATGNTSIAGTLGVTGAITGNLTGNVTGSSGSCTGNSATATTASSCSGNSATATTATNVSGGTASVTTLSITQGAVISGTYTCTISNTTNVTSSTGYQVIWNRVGNVVTFSGQFGLRPTSAAATYFDIDIPVASAFVNALDASGIAGWLNAGTGSPLDTGAVYANSSTAKITIYIRATTAPGVQYTGYFSGTYKVV